MIIRDLSGDVIAETSHRTLRATLEDCVRRGVCLDHADLRKGCLAFASLDGMRARNASFWAADLHGADIGLADLRGVDMRCADLKDCCLAESDLSGADLEGRIFPPPFWRARS